MRGLGVSVAAFLVAVAVSGQGEDPGRRVEVSGQLQDVIRSEREWPVVVLAVAADTELSLSLGPDSRVTIDDQPVAQDRLDDALGAAARVRYRETEGGLLIETIDLTSADAGT